MGGQFACSFFLMDVREKRREVNIDNSIWEGLGMETQAFINIQVLFFRLKIVSSGIA